MGIFLITARYFSSSETKSTPQLTFYPPVFFISLVIKEEDKRRRSRGRKRETESRARARYDDRLVVVGCANKTASFVLEIVSEEEDELEIEPPPTQRFFVFFVFLDDERGDERRPPKRTSSRK
jgi:hypothetical protein